MTLPGEPRLAVLLDENLGPKSKVSLPRMGGGAVEACAVT